MKKVLFVGMVFGALALTSCKKDYECEVSVTVNGETASSSATFEDLSKSEAKDKEEECENGGGKWSEK
ncbi:hypothetical protein CW751_06180 [Brumimicrobium salinarum]|uniref:Uncharacterized protein n=1 Tax=Brumimicrobium salinarum TaxID=2058658 RepID=A0A2I0R3N8_9FLAO|nr:hypothetical protein [Brumimicrobium salinarum]PKR81169.1 hypothetical protein CW751_06180 [Brumimicrobium salinarum]